MLSASERLYLHWHQRMIQKLNNSTMTAEQELGLSLWLETGAKRTEWPGWDILLGPKPLLSNALSLRKQMGQAEELKARRKIA